MLLVYRKIDIKTIEERYEIFDNGQVFDKKLNEYCKQYIDSKGYHKVRIKHMSTNLFVHRLIMCKFCPNKDEIYLQVNHKDGNKHNNCLSNLEWVTQSGNQKHAFKNGLNNRRGERNSQAKLTESQVKEIIAELLKSTPASVLACRYNVSETTIYSIRTKRKWIELTADVDFPESKYSNHHKPFVIENEEGLIQDLKDDVDIDILSDKYHLSKRFIRDFKYRTLHKY